VNSGQSPLAEPISVKIREAVRMTGISRSRIYDLMKSGDIEYVKVGSATLILVDSVRRFLLARRVSAPGSNAAARCSDAEPTGTAIAAPD
jgi:excisionase family DNA binding protein